MHHLGEGIGKVASISSRTSAVSRLIIGIDRNVFFRDTVGNKEVSHAEEIYCSLIERGA